MYSAEIVLSQKISSIPYVMIVRFRYEDSDDDLADMESSYAQIEKEEARRFVC